MHQIRIQSDGTGDGTVITTENGDTLNCVRVELELAVNRANTAIVTILLPVVDIHAEVVRIDFVCSLCGDKMIHKCDDSKVRFIDK